MREVFHFIIHFMAVHLCRLFLCFYLVVLAPLDQTHSLVHFMDVQLCPLLQFQAEPASPLFQEISSTELQPVPAASQHICLLVQTCRRRVRQDIIPMQNHNLVVRLPMRENHGVLQTRILYTIMPMVAVAVCQTVHTLTERRKLCPQILSPEMDISLLVGEPAVAQQHQLTLMGKAFLT